MTFVLPWYYLSLHLERQIGGCDSRDTLRDRPDSDFQIRPWANEGGPYPPSAFEEFWASDNLSSSDHRPPTSATDGSLSVIDGRGQIQRRTYDRHPSLSGVLHCPASFTVWRLSLSSVRLHSATPGSDQFTVQNNWAQSWWNNRRINNCPFICNEK